MSFGLGSGLNLASTELVFTDALYDRAVVNLQDSAVDSRITFTRASDRSYFDSNGVLQYAGTDVWPLEYDPATGLVLGRSIWAAATNLLTYSEQFGNAAWGKTAAGGGTIPAVTENAAVAPDGNTTADEVVFVAPVSGDQSILSQNFSATSGVTYNGSLWVKAKAAGDVGKTLLFRHAGASAYTAVALAADWQRVDHNETATSTGSKPYTVLLRPQLGSSSGTVSCYLWGAQAETGSIATPYIPTVAGTVTRAADSVVISDLSSIGFNASEGTLIVRARTPKAFNSVSSHRLCGFSDGTTAERMILYYDGTLDVTVTDGAVTQAVLNGGALGFDTEFVMASAYKANDFALSVNGGAVVTDASGSLPTVTQFSIGQSETGTQQWDSYIRSLMYVPRRLADASLVSLSKM